MRLCFRKRGLGIILSVSILGSVNILKFLNSYLNLCFYIFDKIVNLYSISLLILSVMEMCNCQA